MIHFFRNARKQLYTANKFSKYLVYAVGEIVLVVIGILIALQINNWNERQKRQEKNIQLLHRIHKELGQNIERSDDVIEYYRMVEGDFYTILNQKLTLEDYKADEYLINIILTFTNVNLSDHDAKNLNSFNDNIDTAQDSLIIRISKLYNNYKPLMDKLDEELLELTSEIIKKQRDTKAWFHLSDRQKLPNEAYSYFLNDPFYLNDVS